MSSARRAASQLLATRSVHLRIQPRPANLSESREIYKVLQQFGEISTYKSLRYEYHNPAANSALAIFSTAEAAQRALDASPIRFALEKVVPDHFSTGALEGAKLGDEDIDSETQTPPPSQQPVKDGIDDMLEASPLLTPPLPDDNNTTTSSTSSSSSSPTISKKKEAPLPFESELQQKGKLQTKWFQVTIDRSRVIHQDYVERQPYWKDFSPMKSLAQEDLAKTVPLIGLSDVSKRPPHAHRTPNRVLKTLAEYVENHMPTLKVLWEEAEAERRERGKGSRG
ncbi:uncharacterized protein EI97DRAFT_374163 [Westerdykella ornata]|uniref:Uncharacterized protein n=1 Tax=Westerdykella ornata TaxID=318751 RepID=A0A6A6JMJ8_WESOR|nr:uncharacterized protein EI97DRAFT_374163 [Westerdykella ornata]KAF2277821.1 hypothetical protein EI97DRAFT_374163 [Westerdykella ornata]